jgi:hypothetical protein
MAVLVPVLRAGTVSWDHPRRHRLPSQIDSLDSSTSTSAVGIVVEESIDSTYLGAVLIHVDHLQTVCACWIHDDLWYIYIIFKETSLLIVKLYYYNLAINQH